MCDCSCSTSLPPIEADACGAALHELLQIGMGLARLARDAAEAAGSEPASASPVVEIAAGFERIARAVRRTVRLIRWLEQPVALRTDDGAQRRVRARKQIIRAVEDGIDREAAADDADSLHVELLDRLDSVELEEDVAGRPVAEVVLEILDDLGLAAARRRRPVRRRRLADVAVLRARAAAGPGETREVAGERFGAGRAEWNGAVAVDLSKLTDEELDRLCGPDEDSG